MFQYLRRIFHFRQMDFEFALWQMIYLLVKPQQVYRNFAYRKVSSNVIISLKTVLFFRSLRFFCHWTPHGDIKTQIRFLPGFFVTLVEIPFTFFFFVSFAAQENVLTSR
jgi:hypothetical protein